MFFGRIDERTASNEATGELLERFFPGAYELIRAGRGRGRARAAVATDGRVRIVHSPRRSGGRCGSGFAACASFPKDLDWEGVIWFDGPTDPLARVSKRLRERLRVVRPSDGEPIEFIAGADIVCLASGGVRIAPALIRKALAARRGAGGLRPGALSRAGRRRRAGAAVPGRRRGDRSRRRSSGSPPTPAPRRAASQRARERVARARLGAGRRRARGDLPAAGGAAARPGRRSRGPPPARGPRVHPLRPAHAHRSLPGLRDAGRGAAGDREGARARRDRDHRPQRDLRARSRPARSPRGSGGSR